MMGLDDTSNKEGGPSRKEHSVLNAFKDAAFYRCETSSLISEDTCHRGCRRHGQETHQSCTSAHQDAEYYSAPLCGSHATNGGIDYSKHKGILLDQTYSSTTVVLPRQRSHSYHAGTKRDDTNNPKNTNRQHHRHRKGFVHHALSLSNPRLNSVTLTEASRLDDSCSPGAARLAQAHSEQQQVLRDVLQRPKQSPLNEQQTVVQESCNAAEIATIPEDLPATTIAVTATALAPAHQQPQDEKQDARYEAARILCEERMESLFFRQVFKSFYRSDAVIPILHADEVNVGSRLGTGLMCEVHAIDQIILDPLYSSDSSTLMGTFSSTIKIQSPDRSVKLHSARQKCAFYSQGPDGQGRYALKQCCQFSPPEAVSSSCPFVVISASKSQSAVAAADAKPPVSSQDTMTNHQHENHSQHLPTMNATRLTRTTVWDVWSARIDLVVETRLLSYLQNSTSAGPHPHIIQLRAVLAGPELSPRYGIVLDRLSHTLKTQIQQWRNQQNKQQESANFQGELFSCVPFFGSCRLLQRHHRRVQFWQERLQHALHLTEALSFLHSRRIVHRDIKPDNLGFDMNGNIKIFDFGLARPLPPSDFHLMSACTGSLRYMAPEVATGKPYREGCDVYSLALVIWEMLALRGRPYALFDEHNLTRFVHQGKSRPTLPLTWPNAIRKALNKAWHCNPHRRSNAKALNNSISQLVVTPPSLYSQAGKVTDITTKVDDSLTVENDGPGAQAET